MGTTLENVTMIRTVTTAYIIALVLASIGWELARQGVSLPVTLAASLGFTSLMIVIVGAVAFYASKNEE